MRSIHLNKHEKFSRRFVPKNRRDLPSGENRTTLTGAVCLLSVARYSTRGGCGAGVADAEVDALFATDGGRIFGCIIHTYESSSFKTRTLGVFMHQTDPNVVVFAPRRESIRLSCVVLIVARTRFLEGSWLEVAAIDRFVVVPSNFERPYAHGCDGGSRKTRNTRRLWRHSDSLLERANARLCNGHLSRMQESVAKRKLDTRYSTVAYKKYSMFCFYCVVQPGLGTQS